MPRAGLPTCLTNSSAVSELVSNVPGWSTLSFNGSSAIHGGLFWCHGSGRPQGFRRYVKLLSVVRAADQALTGSGNQYWAAQISGDLGRVLHVDQPFLVRAPVRNVSLRIH